MAFVEPFSESFSVAVVDDDPKLRTRLAMQLGESARSASFSTAISTSRTSGWLTDSFFNRGSPSAHGLHHDAPNVSNNG